MLKYHLPSEVAAIGSLVALIASISATGASANIQQVHPEGLDQDLSARIASVITSIDQKGPTRLHEALRPELRVAQWRN
jgi:hypothetical protein